MGKTTAIAWTDSTWNPWRGCLKVSPGCKNCYMYREQTRYGNDPKVVVRASKNTFNNPLTWKIPRKVFTCSWSDWFIDQADEWRDEAWDIIRHTQHLTYQILTKRPENIVSHLPFDWGDGWPNVWLGVSVESQDYEYRVDELFHTPAAVYFVSYEPALGPLDLTAQMRLGMIDWLISGGESGPDNRPTETAWVRSIRDQCAQHGVAYFPKQNGGNIKIDGSYGGHLLDGKIHQDFPKQAGQP
jgi:protein gp37